MNIELQKSFSITEARRRLPSLVHEVETGGAVELTRRGQPVAVLVSPRDFLALSGVAPNFFTAIQAFRSDTDLQDLEVEDVFRDVRDRSPGREVDL